MGFDFGDIWNPIEQTSDTWGRAFGNNQVQANPAPAGPTDGLPTHAGPGGQTIIDQTGQPPAYDIGDAGRQALLTQQGGIAGKFADRSEQGYNIYGAQGDAALAGLRRQMNGTDSVSALQLRQALGQQLAQQRSFAAGASPRNAAGAARTAAIQMGRASSGMSGQQAIAGLQERNQAATQYGNLLGTLRGQDLNAALSSRQNAESGYGAGMYGAPQPSWIQQYGPAIVAGAGVAAAAASDRRLKKNVKDGGKKADRMLNALRRASSYKYKDGDTDGDGEFVGPMAQDLEAAGSRAVFDTPRGKMVHGARLATENTAMLAALRDRVAKLEGGARR